MGVRVEEEVDLHQRKEKKKKKKNKKKNDAGIVHGGAAEMNVEDCGEKSRKKCGKRKRKEERDEGIYYGYEEGKNDFEDAIIEEKKNQKKAKRNKMRENDGGDCKINEDKSDTNGKGQVEEERDKGSLDIIGGDMELGDKVQFEMVKDKEKKQKKQKKEKKNKNKDAICSYSVEIIEDRNVVEDKEKKWKEKKNRNKDAICSYSVEIIEDRNVVEDKEKKRREKKNKNKDAICSYLAEIIKDRNVVEDKEKKQREKKNKNKNAICSYSAEIIEDRNVVENKENKRMEKKNKNRDAICSYSEEIIEDKNVVKDKEKQRKEKKNESKDAIDSSVEQKRDGERESLVEMERLDHIMRKKTKLRKDVGEQMVDKGQLSTKVNEKNADHRKPGKRVKFSSNIEVFPASDGTDAREENQGKKSSYGRWYSQEEDKMIKDAVFNYIEEHGWGEEGLNMVLNVHSYPQIRSCWKEISAALPWRSKVSVYNRAHILFERDESRKWTLEEKEFIKKFHEEHGPRWKTLAQELGKSPMHVKDTWRRIKLPNLKKGPWSQEEYQTLFDLVNMDLRMKVSEERKSNNGMLRDNISWEAISTKMGTRTNMDCCHKWYDRLASPLVKAGTWAPADDYRLVNALLSLDACCVEDVNWDDLIQDRPGTVCLKRFKQMINHLGEHGIKPFAEQVEVLANRYCPDLLEIREAAENSDPVE